MAISISLTGISPLHGSHPALPIACDAFNARTVAIGEYHYIFCAVMACKVLRLLYGRIFLARLPVKKCHGVFSAQLRHKRKVSGLPYDTPTLSCGYVCQRTGSRFTALSAERGTQTNTFLNLEHQDSLHEL